MRESKLVSISNFSGGNQDPISWLEEFTRACDANGTSDNRKLLVVPAYLKEPASTWWTMNQTLQAGDANRITQWTGNNNNSDFKTNFVNTFCTTTLTEIWTTELEKRQQNLNENVDSYASALQELYRRVEVNGFQYPEAMKARRLVNGLLPELHLMVKPHNDQTWTAALDRAKAYELTYQNQKSVTAYMNRYAPTTPNTQSNELSNAITTLTQQFSQLMTNMSSQQTQQPQYGQPRRNYQNNYQNNYRQQRPNQQNRPYQQPANLVCYNCGQPGHIRRDCSTINNNNNFNNNNSMMNNNNRQVPIINNTLNPQQTNNTSTDQTKALQQLLNQLVATQQQEQPKN